MSHNSDCYLEFSSKVAKKYGLDIAIMYGFFCKVHYLSTIQDDMPSFPTVEHCKVVLHFWDEEKIRSLIAQLYTLKLI